jgi:hypothetical protein
MVPPCFYPRFPPEIQRGRENGAHCHRRAAWVWQGGVVVGDGVRVTRSADANVLLWNASAALSGGAIAAGRKDGVRAAAASVVRLEGVEVVDHAQAGLMAASSSQITLVR